MVVWTTVGSISRLRVSQRPAVGNRKWLVWDQVDFKLRIDPAQSHTSANKSTALLASFQPP
jgi:hypothetical protein